MKKEHKTDLEKLRDSIDIHRISVVQRQTKKSSVLDEFPITEPKEKIKIMGLDKYLKRS